MQGVEIDRFIIRHTVLPAPKEDTDPFKRECPDGGLVCYALVALLLVVGPCPERMPEGFSGPFHERLPQELRALEAPVDPRFVPAAFRHRRDTSVFLQRIGGGIALALFAEGDQETRCKDSTSAWERIKQGEVGMALGALRDGGVEVRDRLEGHAQLGDEGLDQQGMGDDNAFIGGQWGGALDGLEAFVDDVGVTHVMGAEEALEGGAAGELDGFESRPLGEEVAEDGRVFVVKPLEDLRKVVLQGTGKAIGEAYFVADEATAMFDELRQRT